MQISTLTALLQRQDVKDSIRAIILGSYHGAYSLGVIRSPRDKNQYALRLRVVGPVSGDFPDNVTLNGEQIPLVTIGDFDPPRPLVATP